MPIPRYASQTARALAQGFRSGLEGALSSQLERAGVPVEYEKLRIKYRVPERVASYKPDWRLPNGIIVESKGKFETEDRQKHKLIKAEHPALDIRFVFSRSKTYIRKGSPTTYGMWCEEYGFLYADKLIPQAWLDEPFNQTRWDASEQWLKA